MDQFTNFEPTARLPKCYYFGSFLFLESDLSIGYKNACFFDSLIYSTKVG